jgi:hypothetical protein
VSASRQRRRHSGNPTHFLSLWSARGSGDVRARFPSRHGRPQEAHQLAGDRGDGDRRSFAVADEMAVTPMQPLLRPPRLPDDLLGLGLAPARQRAADHGAMSIVPGGLDEPAAGGRVAGFRKGATPLGLAGGVLARHQRPPSFCRRSHSGAPFGAWGHS